jgi:hypothetical protein
VRRNSVFESLRGLRKEFQFIPLRTMTTEEDSVQSWVNLSLSEGEDDEMEIKTDGFQEMASRGKYYVVGK